MDLNDLDKRRWEHMLHWLREHGMDTNELSVVPKDVEGAGRGLFAVRDIPPSDPTRVDATPRLFKFPSNTLMNVETVSRLYTSFDWQMLTGVQLVTLHMLLHRPFGDEDSLDPAFGPYISTLPRSFSDHPLSWFVKRELKQGDEWERHILGFVPPSTYRKLTGLHERFNDDWNAVWRVLTEVPDVLSSSTRRDVILKTSSLKDIKDRLIVDYIWAWLNVNTRCIFFHSQWPVSHPDNFTLCPVLDFANHSKTRSDIFPKVVSDQQDTVPDRNLICFGPDQLIAQGQEIFFHYGDRSNSHFFSEYGFVNQVPEGAIASGAYRGEVEVEELVKELLTRKGGLGDQLKQVLEDEGYWGEWTMYSSPGPAYPDFRLVSALRLITAFSDPSDADVEAKTDAWRRVTSGQVDAKIEQVWRDALRVMCEYIVKRANERLSKMSPMLIEHDCAWQGRMTDEVRTLWKEERDVAEAVIRSILAGAEF